MMGWSLFFRSNQKVVFTTLGRDGIDKFLLYHWTYFLLTFNKKADFLKKSGPYFQNLANKKAKKDSNGSPSANPSRLFFLVSDSLFPKALSYINSCNLASFYKIEREKKGGLGER